MREFVIGVGVIGGIGGIGGAIARYVSIPGEARRCRIPAPIDACYDGIS